MANNKQNTSQGQPKTKTQILRDLANLAIQKGITLREIARTAEIDYNRLRRIIIRDFDPTLDEAEKVENAIQQLASQKAHDFSRLASV